MSTFNLTPFLEHLTKLQLCKFKLTEEHAEVISKLNKLTDLLLTEMVQKKNNTVFRKVVNILEISRILWIQQTLQKYWRH